MNQLDIRTREQFRREVANALSVILGGNADGTILTKEKLGFASIGGTSLATEATTDGGGDSGLVLLGDGSFGSVPSHTHGYSDLSGVAASSHTHEMTDLTVDTEQEYVWFADFLLSSPSQNGWSNATSGGSIAGHWDALIDTTDNGVGVVQLQTGTSASGYYSLCTYNDKFFPGQGEFVFEARLCPELVSDATQEFEIYVGFGHNTYATASGTHECALVYKRATLGKNWVAITKATGSETQVDTGVECTEAVLQKLKIVLSSDGATATFYIDGDLVATITTNMPTSRMGLVVGIFKTAGTTQRELWVDWTRFHFKRTSPR